MPVTPDHPQWRFPGGLYGTQADVKRFTRRCAHSGVTQGTWRAAWAEAPKLSVIDAQGDLFVSDKSRWYPAAGVLWRLNRAWIDLLDECGNQGRLSLYPALADELRSELWFSIAMLGGNAPSFFCNDPKEAVECDRGVLAAMISWLPEMLALSSRIANTVVPETAYHLRKMPIFRYQWAMGMLDLSRRCGYKIEIPTEEDEGWDLVEQLAEQKIVRPAKGRWELCD